MSTELSLPDYMNPYPQEVIDVLTQSKEVRVIACGVDPRDNSLTFVTNEAKVMTIIPNSKMFPIAAYPMDDGRAMCVSFNEVGFKSIDVSKAVVVAKVCNLGEGELFVNGAYVCNIDASDNT